MSEGRYTITATPEQVANAEAEEARVAAIGPLARLLEIVSGANADLGDARIETREIVNQIQDEAYSEGVEDGYSDGYNSGYNAGSGSR